MHHNKHNFLLVLAYFVVAFALSIGVAHAQILAGNDVSLQEIVLKLQEQIKTLQAQITELKTQVKFQEEELNAVKIELRISRSLYKGVDGDDVKELQAFLKQFPDIYPEGLVTGFFGSLTEEAVRRFQEKHYIETIGIVGPKTLSKIQEIFSTQRSATPSGTIPASPAQPMGHTGTTTVPAIPAQPPAHESATSSLPAETPTSETAITSPSSVTLPAGWPSITLEEQPFIKGRVLLITIATSTSSGIQNFQIVQQNGSPYSGNLSGCPKQYSNKVSFSTYEGLTAVIKTCNGKTYDYKFVLLSNGTYTGTTAVFTEIVSTPSTTATTTVTTIAGSSTTSTQTQTTTSTQTSASTPSTTTTATTSTTTTSTASSTSSTTGITDTIAPTISNVQATNITETSATITWSTNEASDSQVEYGLTDSYGSNMPTEVSFVTSHSIALIDLASSALYHYRVKSKDAAGNMTTSGDYMFTTLTPPPPPASTAITPAITQIGTLTGLKNPAGIGIHPSTGKIYVADYHNDHVKVFDSQYKQVQIIGSSRGSADGLFSEPWDIAFDSSGKIFVSDTNNTRVQVFDINGNFLYKFSVEQSYQGLAINSQGDVYGSGNAVKVFDTQGNSKFSISTGSSYYPRNIAIDKNDQVYFSNWGGGSYTRSITINTSTGSKLSEIPLSYDPLFIDMDDSSRIWVADLSAGKVHVYDSTGTSLTEFAIPGAHGLEISGTTLYVSSYYDNVVRVYSIGQANISKIEIGKSNLASILESISRILKTLEQLRIGTGKAIHGG
ncbi:MAG: NHL repeat containing protein [Parcubacteria group bacterium Gr01-1014_29]|nr:MAG: NHL repeat containing protein [Parcubacteria group bacterium Gr01-1014_29]